MLLNSADKLLDVVKRLKERRPLYHRMFFDCSIMLSPMKPGIGTNWILSALNSLLQEVPILGLIVPFLNVVDRLFVHLVDGNNHLLDAKRVR